MEKHEYTYPAKVTEVLDGDTVYFMVTLGLRCFTYIEGRMARINAPEKNRIKSREAGIAARDYLQDLLLDQSVYIKTEKIDGKRSEYICEKNDSWSRWIVEIYVKIDEQFINLNDAMVTAGHAIYRNYK